MKIELINFIKKTPNTPGIYQFLDINGKILYVGKAKDLRKRLTSYTKKEGLSERIRRMTLLAEKIEITQTINEKDALLLECNLIKKFNPRFNILLKDGKTFPYIEIEGTKFGKLSKHRGKKNKNHFYFGPFANGFYVNQTLDILKKSFLLRGCSDAEFKNRKKPCLEYQIKRCSAPCVNYIDEKSYKDLVKEAVAFLNGKNSKIQESLSRKMEEYSVNMNYENAAMIRDRIKAITAIQSKQNINLDELGDSDLICIQTKNDLACLYVSFYRGGKNFGAKPYFIKVNSDDQPVEILQNFIVQFYSNENPPKNILTNLDLGEKDLLEEYLSDIGQIKIQLSTPKKGLKFKLITGQLQITNQELVRKDLQNIGNKERLAAVKELFNLPEIPKRIEVYDNSHISGSHKIGAMICAGMDGFIKNGYRKFNIENDKVSDDTAMMKEVLTRRFKRIDQENWQKPDLIILDGGKGQLSSALEVFEKLNLTDLKFIAISKGPNRNAGEEYFHEIGKESFTLEKNNPVMYYLQNLRDEAHRFAITSHRNKRKKETFKSSLDAIDKIGSKKKRLLLNHFGSIEEIKNATIEDLMKVEGIGNKMAQNIKNSFNK